MDISLGWAIQAALPPALRGCLPCRGGSTHAGHGRVLGEYYAVARALGLALVPLLSATKSPEVSRRVQAQEHQSHRTTLASQTLFHFFFGFQAFDNLTTRFILLVILCPAQRGIGACLLTLTYFLNLIEAGSWCIDS